VVPGSGTGRTIGVSGGTGWFGGSAQRPARGARSSGRSGEPALTAERLGTDPANSDGSALAENRRPAEAASHRPDSGSTGAGGGTGVVTSGGLAGLAGDSGLVGLAASRRRIWVSESGASASGGNARDGQRSRELSGAVEDGLGARSSWSGSSGPSARRGLLDPCSVTRAS
jgi:hypothetical protein